MNTMDDLGVRLSAGIAELGISLPAETCDRMLQYLGLIEKWNQVYNLTATREPGEMLKKHLLDSLSVLPHITGPHVVDVGSGAGLPGIPLALARPDWRVVLLESNHKKAAFLKQASVELSLKNTDIAAVRVEDFHPDTLFNTVISRAFSDLGEFVRLAGRLCLKDGKLAAMKGIYPHEELAQVPAGFAVEKTLPVSVPGLEAARHLVIVGHAL